MDVPRTALSLLVVFVGVSIGAAQAITTQQVRPGMPPPRDRAAQQKTGTAMISGRITALDSGSPLRRVQVRIQGSELRGGRTALTDVDGRYYVRELPAGRYTVGAVKPGYVRMTYGQKRPMQDGTPVELADGQKLETVNIALPRGGVITGRVFDDFGEPVVDARVSALQYRWFNARRRANTVARPATTNDRGEYRIWGLAPGEYYVGAAATDRVFGGPDESIGTSGDNSGYAPVYYPGTSSIDDAQRVTVAAAQELGGIDLSLVLVRTVRVSGTALTSEGRPMTNGYVNLVPRTDVEGALMSGGAGSNIDSNGAFTVTGVAAGDYLLVARGSDQSHGPRGPNAEFASTNLSVGAEDVRNIVVTATKGVRVTGRIIFEGGTPSEWKSRMRVSAVPAEVSAAVMMGGASAPVTAEGAFELSGVLGRRRLTAGPSPDGWTIKSIRIGGADVTDTGYDFGKEDVSNVEILLTNRISTVAGTVKDDKGEPVTDAVVLIFSADEEYWTVNSRRVSNGRLDQNGMYRIRGLPAGSYYAVALDSEPDEWGNPELFGTLKKNGTPLTVKEGETQTLELRLRELPQ